MAKDSVSLKDYFEAILAEREKALRIKETADLEALHLAREIQTYKDEKANELRAQIESERGNYATREDIASLRDYFDVLHKPVIEFMAAASSANRLKQLTFGQITQILSVMVALGTIVVLILLH